MEKKRFNDMSCSIAQSLEVVGDWWSMLIVRDIFLGIDRFDDMVANLGLSRNLLTQRLRWLETHGVVARRAYQARPSRYAYLLTEAGHDLVGPLLALLAWGDKWRPQEQGAPMHLRHLSCHSAFTPEVSCSCCKRLVTAADVQVVAGPGGRSGPGTALIAKRLRNPDRSRNEKG